MIYIIRRGQSKEIFDRLLDLCHKSKNLYNHVNFVFRQAFIGNHESIPEYTDLIRDERFVSRFDMNKRLAKLGQSDYRSLKSKLSQEVVHQVSEAWSDYFKTLKAYKKGSSSRMTGRPKMPRYKEKNGMNTLSFSYQACFFDKKSRILKLGKEYGSVPMVVLPAEIFDFKQVRIVPREGFIQIEVVYDKKPGKRVNAGGNNVGIDLGVDNLATVTSDDAGLAPLVVNGRPVKSVNQFYNRRVAELRSILATQGMKTSQRVKPRRLTRRNRIRDYFHKSTRMLVDWFVENDIGKVFVGYNTGWKRNADMGRNTNLWFVFIPHEQFIRILKYKCEEAGIQLELVGEAYTSKCSALDKEEICKHDAYMGSRVRRGLFRTAEGRRVNADVNGSLNILRIGLNREFDSGTPFNPSILTVVCDAPSGPADRGSG